MTDDDLDAMVLQAARVTDAELESWPISTSEAELWAEIVALTTGDPTAADVDTKSRGPRARRKRLIRAIALVAAAAVAAAVVVTVTNPGDSGSAFAAALVEFARKSPRLLMNADGWTVTDANDYGDAGEMGFASGNNEAELFWRPGPAGALVNDRTDSGAVIGTRDVLGQSATVIRATGSAEFTAIWRDGDRTIEFTSSARDAQTFEQRLDSLRRVDVKTWLAAMPASVVQPPDRSAVVKQMLADIPLPRGFDVKKIEEGPTVNDRYQLGAKVVRPVSCAWFDQWLAAKGSGDTAQEQQAVDAMVGSAHWAVIEEMNRSGDYGKVLAMAVGFMVAGNRARIVYARDAFCAGPR